MGAVEAAILGYVSVSVEVLAARAAAPGEGFAGSGSSAVGGRQLLVLCGRALSEMVLTWSGTAAASVLMEAYVRWWAARHNAAAASSARARCSGGGAGERAGSCGGTTGGRFVRGWRAVLLRWPGPGCGGELMPRGDECRERGSGSSGSGSVSGGMARLIARMCRSSPAVLLLHRGAVQPPPPPPLSMSPKCSSSLGRSSSRLIDGGSGDSWMEAVAGAPSPSPSPSLGGGDRGVGGVGTAMHRAVAAALGIEPTGSGASAWSAAGFKCAVRDTLAGCCAGGCLGQGLGQGQGFSAADPLERTSAWQAATGLTDALVSVTVLCYAATVLVQAVALQGVTAAAAELYRYALQGPGLLVLAAAAAALPVALRQVRCSPV
jgi:hypothetical protein